MRKVLLIYKKQIISTIHERFKQQYYFCELKVKKINYFLVSLSPNHEGFDEVKKSKPEIRMLGPI
jgi:hypothetical protein